MNISIKEALSQVQVVPVIKLERANDTLPLIDALITGGLPVAEITFRTAAASEAIAQVKQYRPKMILGAGTVLTIEQAKIAIDAGATFIVAPGFNPYLVDFCLSKHILVIPGVNSPTQVELGIRKGLKILKFFPAEASGGIPMLKSLCSVYDMQFMPTGGINQTNICSYLSFPKVIACGGTWMVKANLINAGKFEEIAQITKKAVDLINK